MYTYSIRHSSCRKALLKLLLPVALALIVVACGWGTSPSPTPAASPVNSPSPAATASATTSVNGPGYLPTLRSIKSLVRHQHGQTEQEVPIDTSRKLSQGDAVNVDVDGRATLRFTDALKVEIFHDSQLNIKGEIDPTASVLETFALVFGTALNDFDADKVAQKRVRVTTKWAVIDDLGTEFVTHYDPITERTWVVVRSGLVEVTAPNANVPPAQRSVRVPAGKQTWVEPGQPPVPPVPAVRTEVGNLFQTLDVLTDGVLTEAAWLPSLNPFVPSRVVVPGGGTIQGVITLSGPAYEGGVPVTLVNLNAGALEAPASVSVPEGATSQTFTMTATAVLQPTTVDLFAAYGNTQQTLTVVIEPPPATPLASTAPSPQISPTPTPSSLPRLADFQLSPSEVDGGDAITGTVTLSDPAPEDGVAIQLSSSDPQVAPVGSSVRIAAGQQSASFSIPTAPIVQDQPVTITASDGRTQPIPQTFTVRSTIQLADFKLDLSSVVGGNGVQGEVVLTQAAPEGGIEVALSSGDQEVRIPSSVAVDEGQISAQFKIGTLAVQQAYTATITASYNGVERSQDLNLTPPPLPDLTVAIPDNNPQNDCTSLIACFPVIGFTVTNAGSVDVTQRFLVTVQIGTSASQELVVSRLAAGVTQPLKVSFDSSACSLSCSVVVRVDPGNTIRESKDDNNAASQTLNISSPAPSPSPSPIIKALPSESPSATAEPAPIPN